MKFESLDQRYFGKEYEIDLIGEVKIENPEKFQEEISRLQKKAEKIGWKPRQSGSLPFREALEITKKIQPGDPANPRQEFAKELKLAFAEEIGAETEKEMDGVKVFTSVGGPLDAHGIDGFISFRQKGNEEENIVTFDITRNPEKTESTKADFVIGPDVPDKSDKNYDKRLLETASMYAKQSAAIWQERRQAA